MEYVVVGGGVEWDRQRETGERGKGRMWQKTNLYAIPSVLRRYEGQTLSFILTEKNCTQLGKKLCTIWKKASF
jgi:hypothetical protein